MSCEKVQEHFSAHLEGELSAAESRRVKSHLARCAPCMRLHRAVAQLVHDLPSVLEPTPDGLVPRVIARVPLARPAGPRRAEFSAWRRAAAWAVVFIGSWWQVAGGAVSSFAKDEVAPVAESFVDDVSQLATQHVEQRRGFIGRIGEVNDGLTTFGRELNLTLFGDQPPLARPAPADAGAQTSPAADAP